MSILIITAYSGDFLIYLRRESPKGEEMSDLIIRNALTRKNGDDLVDIVIKDGKVSKISAKISDKGNEEIDAKGNLVTESFINGHLHLDKVYTLDRAGQKAIEEYNEGGMSNALSSIASAAHLLRMVSNKDIELLEIR